MALGKKRGRKPSKKTLKERTLRQKDKHWVDCDCEKWGDEVDGDVTRIICPYCVQKMVMPPPPPKQPPTAEEEEAKRQRKIARKERAAAIARGEAPPPKKDLGFGRGWHRRATFTAEVDGKTKYYSFGKEVTKKEYNRVAKEHSKKKAAKVSKTAGWGRGWHLKDKFVAPTGDLYESGSLVRKASVEPDEAELQILMEQHADAGI